jgi:hypothetical protein
MHSAVELSKLLRKETLLYCFTIYKVNCHPLCAIFLSAHQRILHKQANEMINPHMLSTY